MEAISIEHILENMPSEKNYFGDMWETCLNENRKRFTRSKLKDILKKMEVLGYVKKYGHKNEAYYVRNYHYSPEENIGFINDLTFTYESKINKAIKNLENKKIFLDISKDLNAFKFSKYTKADYEVLLEAVSNMFELASSILWTIEDSGDAGLKKELKKCFAQINEFLDEINQKLLNERKTSERILLQRRFSNKIPKAGYLKI